MAFECKIGYDSINFSFNTDNKTVETIYLNSYFKCRIKENV